MAGTHTPNLSIGTPQYNDKTAHYVAFAGLAFLLSWTWTTRRPFVPRGILFALCVAALYGALDEYTQLFVPGRFGDVADWVADALGAVSGVCTFWLLDLLWRRFVKRYWY